MIIPTSSLTSPGFASILLIGPPFTGKTYSMDSLHQVLVKRKLSTKMVYFDLDGGANGGGAETVLRLAREGNWVNDIELHRFDDTQRRIKDGVSPGRNTKSYLSFKTEFNELFDRLDQNNQWIPGKEIGAVVVDSCSGLSSFVEDMEFVLNHVEIAQTGNSAVTFNHWRLIAEKVMEIYECAKSLPCYFVLTCHVETKQQVIKGAKKDGSEDVSTHKLYDIPLLPTNILRDGIAKSFGVVLYSVFENNQYEWITRPTDRIRSAGTRGRDNLAQRVKQDFGLVLDI